MNSINDGASGSRRPDVGTRRKLTWLTAFAFGNALFAILVAASNISLSSVDMGMPGVVLVLALVGHFLFFAALLAGLPMLLALLFARPAWMFFCAVLLQAFWLYLLLIDAKVFALYRFHLDGMVVNMLLGGALSDQVTLSVLQWALVGLAVVVVLGLVGWQAWWWWRRPFIARSRHAASVAWMAALMVMVSGQGLVAYYDARGDRRVLSGLRYVPWSLPVTAKSKLRTWGIDTVPNGAPAMSDTEGQLLAYPLQALQCDKQPLLNVLIIVGESLRHDMLDPQVMPHTWRYAQQSQTFARHYSSGNSTRFGLFGLMYGLPGAYWHGMLAEQRGPVLLDVLLRNGYRMHIYGSAPLFNPEFDRTVFSAVRDRIVNGSQQMHPPGQPDRYVVERMIRDLRAHPRDQRFFGFVFLDASHAPYWVPEGYPSVFEPMAAGVNFLALGPGHDRLPIFNRYRTAVHYSDQLIGMLLAALQTSAMADDTVVVITGDHGEEFNELKLNYWGHNGDFSDYQVRTPFVLHWPGKAPRRVELTTSHEDLVPTLMKHALGCRNDVADYSTGRDLFEPGEPDRRVLVEAWSQRGIRQGDRTWLFDSHGVTALGPDYLPLNDEHPDPRLVPFVWEKLTHFRPH